MLLVMAVSSIADVMLQEADCYISAPLLTATLAALLTEEEQSGP